DSHGAAHLIVFGPKGETLYHIRAATVNQDAAKYPEAKMAKQIKGMLNVSLVDVTVDKAEFLRILGNAATIGSLDASVVGGQAQTVDITVSSDGERSEEHTSELQSRF